MVSRSLITDLLKKAERTTGRENADSNIWGEWINSRITDKNYKGNKELPALWVVVVMCLAPLNLGIVEVGSKDTIRLPV